MSLSGQLKGCVARLAGHYCPSQNCGCSSVGRAPPCQGGRREFEPRHPLQPSLGAEIEGWSERAVALAKAGRPNAPSYGWQASPVMYYVYLLQSRSRPTQRYIGSTCDLRQRLKQHNEGRSPHAAKFRPWTLRAYVAFADEKTAVTFERYLKSGSGTLVRQSTLSLGSIDVSLAKTCRTPLAQSPRRLSPSKGFRPTRDRTPTRA